MVTALRASEASEPVTEATTELAPAGKLASAEVRIGSAAGTLLAPAKPGAIVSGRSEQGMRATYPGRCRRRRQRRQQTRRCRKPVGSSHGYRRPSWTWCRSSSGRSGRTGTGTGQWWPCCQRRVADPISFGQRGHWARRGSTYSALSQVLGGGGTSKGGNGSEGLHLEGWWRRGEVMLTRCWKDDARRRGGQSC